MREGVKLEDFGIAPLARRGAHAPRAGIADAEVTPDQQELWLQNQLRARYAGRGFPGPRAWS